MLIVSAVLAIAAAYGAMIVLQPAPGFVAPALAYAIGTSIAGMFVLGAARNSTLRPWLAAVFVMVLLTVTGTLWWVLALPADEGAGGALLLGLPRRTAMVLCGVGAVPMLLLPLAYALAFDRDVLSEEEMRQLRNSAASGFRENRDVS